MDRIATLLLIVPAAPLLAVLLIAITAPRWLRQVRYWPASVTVIALLISMGASVLLLREVLYLHSFVKPQSPFYERVIVLWRWATIPEASWRVPVPQEGDKPLTAGAVDFSVDIALRVDALTALMLVTVSGIAFLVGVYSIGYMAEDRGYWRYFCYFNLFVFSMTMLVSASNFLLLFVFWEAVGLCSYLLIGFWYEKPEAAAAGKKAFLVNRVGDFGFLLGLMLIWTSYGTLDFHTSATEATGTAIRYPVDSDHPAQPDTQLLPGVLSRSPDQYVKGFTGFAICVLLFLGACGKSAQFPLHVWLPDAMEGPTPVSALIHAATMVTAGVYLVARCAPLFLAVPESLLVVAIIGASTALLGAIIALSQFDLKRVLAYSTISQLGYMFLGVGAGTLSGIGAGMFHLFTHAFFKALLFLAAGSVMHAMGNVIDMRRFGGLRRLLPWTHWTFLIGALALAGVFPFSGFWSKDAILGAVHDRVEELLHEPGGAIGLSQSLPNSDQSFVDHSSRHAGWTWVQPTVAARCLQSCYYAALVAAFLTAFYIFRAFFMTFYGDLEVPTEAEDHTHESPAVMRVPLVALAVGTAVVGFLLDQSYRTTLEYLPEGRVSTANAVCDFLGYTPQLAGSFVEATRRPMQFHLDIAALSLLLALAGMGLAMYLYLEERREAEWLAAFFRWEWYRRLLDNQNLQRLRRSAFLVRVERIATLLRLGWLLRLAIGLLLAILWILAAPLMIIHFVSPYQLSANRFYLDELYSWLVVAPLRALARLSAVIDQWVVDGLVNLVGRIPVWVGDLMRSLQMGVLSFYALSMVLGLLIILWVRMMWGI